MKKSSLPCSSSNKTADYDATLKVWIEEFLVTLQYLNEVPLSETGLLQEAAKKSGYTDTQANELDITKSAVNLYRQAAPDFFHSIRHMMGISTSEETKWKQLKTEHRKDQRQDPVTYSQSFRPLKKFGSRLKKAISKNNQVQGVGTHDIVIIPLCNDMNDFGSFSKLTSTHQDPITAHNVISCQRHNLKSLISAVTNDPATLDKSAKSGAAAKSGGGLGKKIVLINTSLADTAYLQDDQRDSFRLDHNISKLKWAKNVAEMLNINTSGLRGTEEETYEGYLNLIREHNPRLTLIDWSDLLTSKTKEQCTQHFDDWKTQHGQFIELQQKSSLLQQTFTLLDGIKDRSISASDVNSMLDKLCCDQEATEAQQALIRAEMGNIRTSKIDRRRLRIMLDNIDKSIIDLLDRKKDPGPTSDSKDDSSQTDQQQAASISGDDYNNFKHGHISICSAVHKRNGNQLKNDAIFKNIPQTLLTAVKYSRDLKPSILIRLLPPTKFKESAKFELENQLLDEPSALLFYGQAPITATSEKKHSEEYKEATGASVQDSFLNYAYKLYERIITNPKNDQSFDKLSTTHPVMKRNPSYLLSELELDNKGRKQNTAESTNDSSALYIPRRPLQRSASASSLLQKACPTQHSMFRLSKSAPSDSSGYLSQELTTQQQNMELEQQRHEFFKHCTGIIDHALERGAKLKIDIHKMTMTVEGRSDGPQSPSRATGRGREHSK